MSFFIKETKKRNDVYYQIYESIYDSSKGYSVHRSYRVLGYLSELKASGIDNPREHFKEEVNRLNKEEKEKRRGNRFATIKDYSLQKHVGYFPAKAVLEKIGVKKYIEYFDNQTGFQFSLYEMLSALIFSRIVNPCSKRASYENVIPNLYTKYEFSYDQILEACEYLGRQYDKFVDMFTLCAKKAYGINTKRAYFDCTNFYFEIDREDEFRRKGPSKEGRHDPIVGLGLLLDADMIPLNMTLYPGNESEKPYIRKSINRMKSITGAIGKIIQVADKGLNCALNIDEAIANGDGYIFSKSVKQLDAAEKAWVFNNKEDLRSSSGGKYFYKDCIDTFSYDYKDEYGNKVIFSIKEKRIVTFSPSLKAKQKAELDKLVAKAKDKTLSKARRDEFGECGKFVKFVSKNRDKDAAVIAILDQEAIDEAYMYCGYNMLITSEFNLDSSEVYSVYHSLWRIEETFRAMKSSLDARPVYLQKEYSIKGHFLICYLTVLIVRLLQFKELGDEFSTDDIIYFMRYFSVVADPSGADFINIGRYNKLYDRFSEKYGILLHLFKLKQRDFKTLGL